MANFFGKAAGAAAKKASSSGAEKAAGGAAKKAAGSPTASSTPINGGVKWNKGAAPTGDGAAPKKAGFGNSSSSPSGMHMAQGAAGAMAQNSNSEKIQKAQKVVQAAQKTVKFVKNAGKVVQKAGGVLTNPIFWIVVAVITVIITLILATVSGVQTIGKNDASDGCYGVGAANGASIEFMDDESVEERANKMATWLLEQPSWEVNDGEPLTKEQAFAIVGNFMAESGLDPTIIEGSAPGRENYVKADNDRIDQYTREHTGRKINIGLGLAQWTWNPGRAEALVNKARETGTQWYEIQPQLELIKDEMNGPYMQRLKSAGFNKNSGKDEKEMAIIFHDIYEGSADNAEQKARRSKMAEDAMKNYVGGTTGGKSQAAGGSCTKGSSLDMTDSIKLALGIAWSKAEHSKAISGVPGKDAAKPEYIQAKEAAMEAQADGMSDLYASCDRVVATIVINTMDDKLPWGNVLVQDQYFQKTTDKWEKVDMADRKPGDIMINHHRSGGTEHIVFFIGELDGEQDVIVQGSYGGEVANVQSGQYVVTDPGYHVYRFKGEKKRTDLAITD